MKFTKSFILFSTVTIILCILTSCIVLVRSSWSDKQPPSPVLSVSSNEADQNLVAKQIDNYTKLLKAQQDQRTAVFDSVTKTLNSIFTVIIAAILSYVIPKAAIAAFSIRKNGVYQDED